MKALRSSHLVTIGIALWVVICWRVNGPEILPYVCLQAATTSLFALAIHAAGKRAAKPALEPVLVRPAARRCLGSGSFPGRLNHDIPSGHAHPDCQRQPGCWRRGTE